MTKTTFNDIAAGRCDTREHTRSGTSSLVGKSFCRITCPFCHTAVTAYIWSLAGGGKRCPGCGAMHGNYGTTAKVRDLAAVAAAREGR